MIALRRMLAGLVLVACVAPPLSAATITVETSGIGLGSCDATRTASETNVATLIALDTGACAFAFGLGGAGSAAAQAQFDTALTLGARASLIGQSSTFAQGLATFTDTVTPLGGAAGATGFLQFVMAVDGSATCTPGVCGNPLLDDRVFGFLSIVSGTFGAGRVPGGTPLSNGTTTRTLQLPIVFGNPVQFSIGLRAVADMSGQAYASEIADWLNTATLTQFVLLDANGQVVNGGDVVSASGLVYPGTAAAVPEPGTLVLLGSALLAERLIRRTRSSRQRTI